MPPLVWSSSSTPTRERVTPSLLQLHWLPVRWRVQFKLCCMMHSVFYGNCPAYLANIVHPTNAGRLRNNLRSASSSDYSMPRLCTKFGERAFSHAGPAAWNALPEDMRANQDRAVFRKQLKTHFFTLAFNVHWLLGFILILYRPSVCKNTTPNWRPFLSHILTVFQNSFTRSFIHHNQW